MSEDSDNRERTVNKRPFGVAPILLMVGNNKKAALTSFGRAFMSFGKGS